MGCTASGQPSWFLHMAIRSSSMTYRTPQQRVPVRDTSRPGLKIRVESGRKDSSNAFRFSLVALFNARPGLNTRAESRKKDFSDPLGFNPAALAPRILFLTLILT